MKTKYITRTALGFLLAIGISYCPSVMAKDVLLAETKVLYKSEDVKAQLWGNKVNDSYVNNLNLILKREDGSIITGYMPDVKGGYGAVLKAVQVKAKEKENQQLLLGVRQGDWRAYSEYRLLDIANPKEIKQLFTGADSFGIVTEAKLDKENLVVRTVRDKEPIKIALNPKMLEDISENRRQVSFSKLGSLTVLDVNHDGVNELFTNQQVTVDNRILADVGALWSYVGSEQKLDKEAEKKAANDNSDKNEPAKEKKVKGLLEEIAEGIENLQKEFKEESVDDKAEEKIPSEKKVEKLWKQDGLTIMKSDVPNRKNSINNGTFFKGGMVYPVKMVAHNGEATYPQIMLNENVELENAWNKILMEETDEYLKAFVKGQADLAFNVLRADKKLITIQLISGKSSFVHHNVSFIPGEKEKYELSSLLDIKSKDLVELLNVLNNNEKVVWDAALTDEWYLRDGNLFLMKNVNGNDEVSGFALKNLKRYIKDSRFLVEEEKMNSFQDKAKKEQDSKNKTEKL